MQKKHLKLIREHQSNLDGAAVEKTRLWWEKYMKRVIPFRGVGIPQNRELLEQWRREHSLDEWSLEEQLEIALGFFREKMAEDKLAGVLYLQNYLYDKLAWQDLLQRYEELYQAELIFDWNICDWFSVRVLGPTIKMHGFDCGAAIADWRSAEYLWRARSSVVPFVNLASESQYYPLIEKSCTTLIKRDERFAKTAVGWILRDISKHDEKYSLSFIQDHLTFFSRESLKNALKYMDKEKQQNFLE